MIEKLLDKLGYISKERIIDCIDIKKENCKDLIELNKTEYQNNKQTKWNYYKNFWFQRGIIEGLGHVRYYVNVYISNSLNMKDILDKKE
jgi:hypothetical protein